MALEYSLIENRIDSAKLIRLSGRVTKIVGLVVESLGPAVSIGNICHIENREDGLKIEAEVVGFKDERVLLIPLGQLTGINLGAVVTSTGERFRAPVGRELIGRTINGLGRPIDGKGPLRTTQSRIADGPAPPALERPPISEPLWTGVKSIDIACTCGRGQRMGIFAGSGVGKSVLLGMIARGASSDVNVVALIGERGREVREFIEHDLKEEGMKRSVVVAVTSDEPALIRLKGAMLATAIAESFRDMGMHVTLFLDSVTRIAMAQREIGLAIREPPATKGYTPSVYAVLPRLLERAGTTKKGSITGFYTVLVEGDDITEPVSDLTRSILDGHVYLSRRFAARNQYPAVDLLDSISRLMRNVADEELNQLAGEVREAYATYAEAEDLISVGAYTKGSSEVIDRAISLYEPLNKFFRQGIGEICDITEARVELKKILKSPAIANSADVSGNQKAKKGMNQNEKIQIPTGQIAQNQVQDTA